MCRGFYAIRRILALFLVSFVIYDIRNVASSWDELKELGAWAVLKGPMKRDWMQTLGHIAMTSLWLLPVIRSLLLYLHLNRCNSCWWERPIAKCSVN